MTRWRNHFSQLLNVHGVNDVRQTEVHSAERLVPEPSAFEVELAVEKLKSETHKLIRSIRNKEQWPKECKESINVPIYNKGDAIDCCNYKDMSLLSTTYKILSNILLSRLTAHAEEIVRGHQCGFQRNRSPTGHVFCIRQILEKK